MLRTMKCAPGILHRHHASASSDDESKGWDDTWQRSLPIGSVVVPPQETHIHPLEASVEWRPDILEAFVLNAEGIPVIKI